MVVCGWEMVERRGEVELRRDGLSAGSPRPSVAAVKLENERDRHARLATRRKSCGMAGHGQTHRQL